MATKKPTLDTHSRPCCGECSFYGLIEDNIYGCFVNPPHFVGFEGDEEIIVYGLAIPSTSVVCKMYDKRDKS